MKAWATIGLGFLLWSPALRLWAQDPPPLPVTQRPTLAISQSFNDGRLQGCTETMYRTLLATEVTRQYNVLPNWYVKQYTRALLPEDPQLWEKTYARLQELDELIIVGLSPEGDYLSGIWLEKTDTGPAIRQAETVYIQDVQDEQLLQRQCFVLTKTLRGETFTERFRSPFLSAGLSLMIPGAGHFYRNTSEGVFWGGVFFISYLTASFLALSDQTALESQQWGMIILALSLADALSAYFLTEQGDPPA